MPVYTTVYLSFPSTKREDNRRKCNVIMVMRTPNMPERKTRIETCSNSVVCDAKRVVEITSGEL